MGKWVVVCAVVALAAGWLLAEERKFKSAAATAAVRKYDAAIAKARGDYERAAKVARDVATRELGEAIKVATRAGDLNAANEIQAEIGALATAEPVLGDVPAVGDGVDGDDGVLRQAATTIASAIERPKCRRRRRTIARGDRSATEDEVDRADEAESGP